jgi:hypothetical protein
MDVPRCSEASRVKSLRSWPRPPWTPPVLRGLYDLWAMENSLRRGSKKQLGRETKKAGIFLTLAPFDFTDSLTLKT